MSRGLCCRLRRLVSASFLCAVTIASPLLAQERNLRFRRLSIEEGLSQSAVNCILQDRHGFIWIGTEDGLNRYDGYEFTVYKHELEDSESLSDSWVWALYEDSGGTLWVGTRGGGLNRYHPETESFSRYQNTPSDPASLSNDRVRVIFEDSGGALWVGTAGGLNRLDAASGTFERFAHDPIRDHSLADDHVLALHQDGSGTLWIGTERGGLDALDPSAPERGFVHHQHDPSDPTSLSGDNIRAIEEDREGQLWIATYTGGLNRLDPDTGELVHFRHDPSDGRSLAHDRVMDVFEDDEGTIWLGTGDGVNEYMPETGTFARYRHDPVDSRTLSSNAVTTLFQDVGGVLWVGTKASGLSLWNAVSGSLSHFKHEASDPASLSANIVTAFAEDGDHVWIGTLNGGLNRLHRPSASFERFRHDPADPSSLSDDRVGSLLVDAGGALWVGTFTGGLNRRDPTTGRFDRYTHDPADPTSLSASGVPAIVEDSRGALWVGTHGGGINRFDRESESFVRYTHDPNRPTSLSNDRVMTFAEDSSGALWIGTAGGGLNRLDHVNGTFSTFRHDPGDPRSLSSDNIVSIHEDRAGVLWIGTQVGLNRWERRDPETHRGVFKRYTERNGLPNNFVYGILEDDEGSLWLSTNRGLSRFDPDNETFKNYDASHGLQSSEFNIGAYFESETGEMFFGGVNGFNAFRPTDIRSNRHAPPVVLTDFLKFDEPVELDVALSDLSRIELDYRDDVVTFEFAALDFTAPEKNTYASRLVGFDTEWMNLGTNRRVTYTNLAPGDYTLRVKAANNDGVESEEGLVVRMHVVPAPWETWWAYCVYGLLACGIVFAYARAQQRKLEREANYSRELEREVEARTRELAEGKHDLEKANSKLEEASLTDALTGLKNRRYVFTRVDKEMKTLIDSYERAKDHERQPAHDMALLMIDLDGYKGINDTYGHRAGDEVLVKIRETLQSACRESDTLIRWGGDEFMVTGRITGPRVVEELAERIRAAVEACRFELEGGVSARLSCSIGFACFPFVGTAPRLLSWEHVLAIADRALYASKNTGRNAWVGILSANTIPGDPKAFLAAIEQNPAALIADGVIEVVTSITHPLRWNKEVETLGA